MKSILFFSMSILSFLGINRLNAQLAENPIFIAMTPHYGSFNEPAPVCGGTIDLSGYVTYDIYLVFQDAEDEMQALFGEDVGGNITCEPDALDMHITSTCGIFQHPMGTAFGFEKACGFIDFYPSLEYDSCISLEYICTDGGEITTSFYPSPLMIPCELEDMGTFEGDSEDCEYFDGGNYRMDSNAIYAIEGIPAGEDHKVLVARITTCGDICFNFGVQLIDDGVPGDAIQYAPDVIDVCQTNPCTGFPMTNHSLSNCSGQGTEVNFAEGGYGYTNYQVHQAGTGEFVNGFELVNGDLTIAGLAEGSYYVSMIDSVGCRDTSSVFMVSAAPDVLALMAMVESEISCAGMEDGAITVACSGGTPPYSLMYQKDGEGSFDAQCGSTLNDLGCGEYTFELTDSHGCGVEANAELICPGPLSLILSSENVTCNGFEDGSVSGSVSGGTGFLSAEWTPQGSFPTYPTGQTSIDLSATDIAPGLYHLSIIDEHLCEEGTDIEITEPTTLICQVNITGDIELGQGTACVEMSGGTPGYSVQWNNGDTNMCIEVDEAGTYYFDAADENGCLCSGSATFTVGISEGLISDVISIYPNPTGSVLYLQGDLSGESSLMVDILDANGKLVKKNLIVRNNQLNVEDLSAGMYSLRLTMDGQFQVLNFVKE